MRLVGRIRPRSWLKLALLVTLGLAVYELYSVMMMSQCSDDELRQSLDALCRLYEQKQVAGDLCEPLCVTKQITYQSCLNYRDGKRIVTAIYRGENLILKSKFSYLHHYPDISYIIDNKTYFPEVADFNKMLIHTLKLNFGAEIPERRDMLTRLWTLPFHEVRSIQDEKAAMRSIWSLVQQDEYLIFRYFDQVQSFPKIKGSCGHYYAVQNAPPGPILGTKPLAVSDDIPWRQRKDIALKFMDLLKDLDSSLGGQFHLCDVKADNFGLTDDNQLKVIDVDMAFFALRLNDQFDLESCRSDEECRLVDCHGKCDLVKKTCQKARSNSNLQAVCNKIFTHKLSTGYRGLLRYPPALLQDPLESLLQECANLDSRHPDHKEENVETVYWKLKHLLTKSIENIRISDYVGF